MIGSLAAWYRRLDTAFRLMAFGPEELLRCPHEILPDPGRPGYCRVDGLKGDHPLHLWRPRKRKARRGSGTLVMERGWR
jgi:hypothetical protein